jgi:hypothetical protein
MPAASMRKHSVGADEAETLLSRQRVRRRRALLADKPAVTVLPHLVHASVHLRPFGPHLDAHQAHQIEGISARDHARTDAIVED